MISITLRGRGQKAFPLYQEQEKNAHTCHLHSTVNGEGHRGNFVNELRDIQIGKEEVQLLLSTDDMILEKNFKESTKNYYC